MSSQLDHLFKNKLEDASIPPASDAWARVSKELPKKNNRAFVLRIAASLLLGGALVSTILWMSRGPAPEGPLSKKIESTTPAEPNAHSVARDETKSAEAKEPRVANKAINHHHVTKTKQAVVDTTSHAPYRHQDPSDVVEELPVQTVAVIPEQPVKKSIVLEYRLPSIAKVSPADVAGNDPGIKEKSGVRKAIEFALDAKHGDAGINLRQATEDLFALNFNKDKIKNRK